MEDKKKPENENNKKAYEKPTVDETKFEATEEFAFMPVTLTGSGMPAM